MFKAQGIVSQVKTMADGSLRVQVDCQEMQPQEEAELFKLRNTPVWFGIEAGEKGATMELPKEAIEFAGQKSLSERLRNVLFVYHQSRGGKQEDFEVFRTKQMERIIQQYKDLLN